MDNPRPADRQSATAVVTACEQQPTRGLTCLQQLASRWINLPDLCPACIRMAMDALDAASVEPLAWHSAYVARVGGAS